MRLVTASELAKALSRIHPDTNIIVNVNGGEMRVWLTKLTETENAIFLDGMTPDRLPEGTMVRGGGRMKATAQDIDNLIFETEQNISSLMTLRKRMENGISVGENYTQDDEFLARAADRVQIAMESLSLTKRLLRRINEEE